MKKLQEAIKGINEAQDTTVKVKDLADRSAPMKLASKIANPHIANKISEAVKKFSSDLKQKDPAVLSWITLDLGKIQVTYDPKSMELSASIL